MQTMTMTKNETKDRMKGMLQVTQEVHSETVKMLCKKKKKKTFLIVKYI